ncbi:MAG: hypothetical protein AAF483_16455 [Planctomycetota bacterium]
MHPRSPAAYASRLNGRLSRQAVGLAFDGANEDGCREDDFLALQEVTKGEPPDSCFQSRGDELKQIGLRYSGNATPGPEHADGSQSIAAEIEYEGEQFQILVVWGKPKPSYKLDVLSTLDFYSSWIARKPTVVLGDFNLDPKIRGAGSDFFVVNGRLNELGLFSACHMHLNVHHGYETHPTLLFNWGKGPRAACFHCDFVYLPQRWLGRVQSVTVEPVFGLHEFSDHRPVTVELK